MNDRDLELGALTVPFTWANNEETPEEVERADFYIDYLTHFPNAILNLPSRNGPDRDNLLKRQKQIINCANEVGKRAYEKGVNAAFHPASPKTSYFRTEEDYAVLFGQLDTRYIGYTPDTGHIKMGGMEPLKVIKDNIDIIKHVHFKDCSDNFEWKKMGTGDIDFPKIVQFLQDSHYDGWIMVEEETPEAAEDPSKVIHHIGSYVQERLLPIVSN